VADTSSFDVVSKVDRQEVDNALNQASKEVGQRYDFRGTGASIAWSGAEAVEIRANADDRVRAALEVFKEKLVRRNVSLKALDHGDPQPAAGGTARLVVSIRQGINDEKARAIVKKIKSDAPKGVQAQVQGDTVRVSSKKKDDLQTVIALLKSADFGIPLQFTNYR
jgi:cyclic-di-GMP-binding protein